MPLGYLDFLSLLADAGAVLTDSGGIQEETTYLGIPCFTLRANTERPITVTRRHQHPPRPGPRSNRRHPSSPRGPRRRTTKPPPLWDGHAAERIADIVIARA